MINKVSLGFSGFPRNTLGENLFNRGSAVVSEIKANMGDLDHLSAHREERVTAYPLGYPFFIKNDGTKSVNAIIKHEDGTLDVRKIAISPDTEYLATTLDGAKSGEMGSYTDYKY